MKQERDQDILQRHLASFLAGQFFNTVTEDDILQQKEGVWLFQGKPLTKGQIEILKKEAIHFKQSQFYQVLRTELMSFAKKSLEKAVTETYIVNSKLLSYFVDLLDTKLKKIADIQ